MYKSIIPQFLVYHIRIMTTIAIQANNSQKEIVIKI